MYSTNETTLNDAQSIIDYVRDNEKELIGKVVEFNNTPFLITKKGFDVKDISDLLSDPLRIKKNIQLYDVGSFIEYYNRFADEDSTIYYNIETAKFKAILDHNMNIEGDENTPRWEEHTATYACPATPEWNIWREFSGKKMNQEDFSLFIEDNLNEINEPKGAQMLDIVSSLKATKNVNFRSALRLDNGQTQITYVEDIEGSAGQTGKLNIPTIIKLGMRLFAGGEGYEIEARFRYRINSGNLIMWYELIRPHKVNEAAIDGTLKIIEENMSIGYLLHGRA